MAHGPYDAPMAGESPNPTDGPHRHRLKVRYGETDQMGRVHHANFLLYLEEARTALMEDLGWPYAELERTGLGLVVRDARLRYRSAALYGDILVVETEVRSVRGASVELSYAVRRDGTWDLVATGSTQLACVDLRGDPPAVMLLPDDLAEAFAAAPKAGPEAG